MKTRQEESPISALRPQTYIHCQVAPTVSPHLSCGQQIFPPPSSTRSNLSSYPAIGRDYTGPFLTLTKTIHYPGHRICPNSQLHVTAQRKVPTEESSPPEGAWLFFIYFPADQTSLRCHVRGWGCAAQVHFICRPLRSCDISQEKQIPFH